jgi:hypothetical protein
MSGVFLLGAEIIKRVQLSEKATLIIGIAEVLIAIGIGFGFGLARKQGEGR